jgi:hypothetical protein
VDTLGAAYARAGRFPEARQHAELALLLARARDENEKVAGIQERLALYQRGIAYQDEKGSSDQSGATEMAAVYR